MSRLQLIKQKLLGESKKINFALSPSELSGSFRVVKSSEKKCWFCRTEENLDPGFFCFFTMVGKERSYAGGYMEVCKHCRKTYKLKEVK